MSLFRLIAAAVLAVVPATSMAQIQPSNPVGLWRCVANSNVVSIDLQLQVNPDQSLFHQGSIVYVNTSRIYNVQGGGRWLLSPPDAYSNEYLFHFQMLPQAGNHASFSIFARPTQDPYFLRNIFQDQNTGGVTETSCQRIG